MSHYSISPSNNSPSQSRESSVVPSERLRHYDSLPPNPGPFTVKEVQQKVKDNPNLDARVLHNIIRGIQTYPSQCSLIAQVQGRPLSPRSVQNIIQVDEHLNLELLQELINSLVLTFKGQSNFNHMQQLLLKE
jgi:hypothetical protein